MNVLHFHCPNECEHPQPFKDGNDMICGRCWCKDGLRSVCVECKPDKCEEDGEMFHGNAPIASQWTKAGVGGESQEKGD